MATPPRQGRQVGIPRSDDPGRRSPRGASASVVVDQPLYEQAHAALAELIASAPYRPGSRLPSERALGAALGVSRLTLRRALASLVEEGVIERRAERGWFVARPAVTGTATELLSFAQMAQARGLVPTARVLENGRRTATLEEADQLRVAPGAPLFDIERLRMLDGIPVCVDRSIIPVALVPWLGDVDLSTSSLYSSLEEHGLVPTSATYTIGVLDADARLAELLDVHAGQGLLLAIGVTHDQHGRPFELARAIYRADRYRIRATLTAGAVSRPTP